MIKQELPIYLLDINEDESSKFEVDFVALVDRPATDELFLAFSENEARQHFTIEDEDEHIITGALMLADTPIYRNDKYGEYYVVFKKDAIKKIAQKFFKKGYQRNVNLMHSKSGGVDGITMFESWITDVKRGIKAASWSEDVPDGSWFGSFKVDNEEVWEKIKQGEVKGFSIEGLFNYRLGEKKKMNHDEIFRKVEAILMDVEKK